MTRREGLSLVSWMVTSLTLVAGCVETRRSLGEDCLKDSDCLSGTCLQLLCTAPGATTDARAVAEATTEAPSESSPDAMPDSLGSAD